MLAARPGRRVFRMQKHSSFGTARPRALADPRATERRPPGRRASRHLPAAGPENRARFPGLPRYGPPMDDADGYFGERVAATYDEPTSREFDPAVVAATVDVLAGLAGAGRALEFAVGTGRIA